MSDEDLISLLLFRGEGNNLDYKVKQYEFEKASDEAKSELLKDILALANAWTTEDAHILIGVRDADKEVVGIIDDIDESRLQQFINGKINKPLEFSYRKIQYRDKILGLYSIPPQARPFYSIKNFGKVKALAVYVRRGSSTDEAKPTEVANMGAALTSSRGPKLKISVDGWTGIVDETGTLRGEYLNWMYQSTAGRPNFPDYAPGRDNFSLNYPISSFYREMAPFMKQQSGRFSFRLRAENVGNGSADDLKIVLRMDAQKCFEILANEDILRRPASHHNLYDVGGPRINFPNAPSPTLKFGREGDTKTATFNLGKIQAGDVVFSEDLNLICPHSTLDSLAFRCFCDQLKAPEVTAVPMIITATDQDLTLVDIKRDVVDHLEKKHIRRKQH